MQHWLDEEPSGAGVSARHVSNCYFMQRVQFQNIVSTALRRSLEQWWWWSLLIQSTSPFNSTLILISLRSICYKIVLILLWIARSWKIGFRVEKFYLFHGTKFSKR